MLTAGTTGKVELDLPDAPLPLLSAEVLRGERLVDGRYVANIRFMEVAPEVEDRICTLIRQWERGLKVFKKKRPPCSDRTLLRFLFEGTGNA